MKYIIIALLCSSCVSTPLERRRKDVLACTKDLIEYNASTTDAYASCKDIYNTKN